MRVRTVAIWAALGMVLTSAAALGLPTPGQSPPDSESIVTDPGLGPRDPADPAHFTAGQALTLDARLGHASLGQGASGETLLFASVTGADAPQAAAPPLHVAIVIDRSGSMAGSRIRNALAAATGIVERMRDGDSVTVVSFDTAAKVVVPPTPATAATRPSIEAQIRAIRLGGDTCISCGLEQAMIELESASLAKDQVNRIILLSDGEATHGIKDVPGMRAMAARMRDRGVSISTIGVDVTFDEKTMAALAIESNGRHYFVANADGLPGIFAQEFDSLVASVASDGELAVDLAPGVEVVEVFDRAFRREGSRVIVPFGTFSAKQEKTVLMRLRVPTQRDGRQPIADVKLGYRDLARGVDSSCRGELALFVKNDGSEQKDLDPFVAARMERSRTAQTLTNVNRLFEQGRVVEARAVLAKQDAELRATQTQALAAATSPAFAAKPGRKLESDFDEQRRAIASAQQNLAPASASPSASGRPAPATGAAGVRANQANATDLAF